MFSANAFIATKYSSGLFSFVLLYRLEETTGGGGGV
jgi:hypothetical protein